MKILCVVPCLQDDLHSETVSSVLQQPFNVEVAVFTERVEAKSFPAKMSKVLNNGLMTYNLQQYDYLLRVDGDTVLPKNFLSENLKAEPDVMGYGYAQLIRVEPFLELMGGKFHPEQDDSYIRYLFAFHGLKSMDYVVQPRRVRETGCNHSVMYFVEQGRLRFKTGFEPLHMLACLRFGYKNLFDLAGYFKALVSREKRFCFADYVWRLQTAKYSGFLK